MVYIYFSIVIVLEEFPDFKEAFEQEYEVRLNSQQIEKIFLKDDEITTLKLKSMEDLSLKDALQLLLNHLKEWLDSIGYNIE
jgi:signal-transduction protein with cAMP-binding, CBS, and nucleotidyltransferase domain